MSVVPAPPPVSEHVPDVSAGGEDLLGIRIAAALIDLALLSALFAILAATIGESTVEEGMFSFTLGGGRLVLYFGLVFVYYVALELAIGQTVGKLLLSVRVVRTDGGRPSARPSQCGLCFEAWTGCQRCIWSVSSPRSSPAHGASASATSLPKPA